MTYPVATNRAERRQLMAITRKTMKSGHWGEWEHRFGPHNPPQNDKLNSAGLTDGWCNNLFAVQLFKVHGCWDRIMLKKHDSTRVVWAEMQRIKNELFGEERIAVEILPRQKDLVDSANVYWFFLVPEEHESFIDVVTNNQGAGK